VTSRPRASGSLRASPAGAVLLLVAVLAAACGATDGTASTSPVASSVAPSEAASSDGSAGATLGPKATPWPGNVVEAVVFLGKADLAIKEAGADLGAAAASQDLEAMWGAADGLATLLERLQSLVPRIADYPETAAAARAYEAAFPGMLAGATLLRDSITAGDSPGVVEGSRQLAAGLDKYAEARRLIVPLFNEAILMQKILVK
jgi:hypothetical protein